jgi:hypothetical protein
MASPLDLNVFLNGPRTYVQGTQILARSGEALFGQTSGVLRQATFHSITDRLVTMVPANSAQDVQGASVGRATYEDGEGVAIPVVWHAQDGPAPQRDCPPACEWVQQDHEQTHPLSAKFSINGLRNGEDFLIALIQTIKELHSALADDVTAIWFTGLRRANIPLAAFPATSGTLTLAGERFVGRNGEFQSMQRISFESGEDISVNAVVTFAFKSKDFSYVD